MWIDFKIVFLREDSQETLSIAVCKVRCELISKLYFYVRIHKYNGFNDSLLCVVNWFQNCIFTWGFTSNFSCIFKLIMLWIDFKIVFLREDSQAPRLSLQSQQRCELISKLYFYVRIHKNSEILKGYQLVVNWFQNCIFTWGFTSQW